MQEITHRNQQSDPFEKDLSEREIEVLTLIAYGYTYKDIANKLNVSSKSIETYRLRIAKKLKLDTRAKLVRYALDQDLISKNIYV